MIDISFKYIDKVLNKFQEYKGKASIFVLKPNKPDEIIYNVITKFTAKRRTSDKIRILICVDSYSTRVSIISYFKERNIDLKDYFTTSILSYDFINPTFKYNYDLVITVGVNDNSKNILGSLFADSKFTLCILTENRLDIKFDGWINSICNRISVDDTKAKLNYDMYSPVENNIVRCQLDDENVKLYKQYTDYINDCINIFTSLDTINACRAGSIGSNKSAEICRNEVAALNGWSTSLDTSIGFYKQIDDIYNPNALLERANNFFNIARLRRNLVTDAEVKLEAINTIISNNPNKKILVVSKRDEFCNAVTASVNKKFGNICGDFHDNIPDTIMYDNRNNIVLIKFGANKGKPRILKSQAISSLDLKRFNNDEISVLSMKISSNITLHCKTDIIIFTSPIENDIIKFKQRYSNVEFLTKPNIVYTILLNGTVEHTLMQSTKNTNNNIVTYIDEEENNFLSYDEKSGDVVL